MEHTPDVIIVGAGIAGQALAYELQKRNVSTIILDRRRGPESTPRGITLQPNGLEALEQINVIDRVSQLGVPGRIIEVKDWDGNLLLEADYGLLDTKYNYFMTVNSTEVESILARLAEQAGAETIWNTRFEELVFNNNTGIVEGVQCLIDRDRAVLKSSIVVGADGPQSRIRKIIGSKTKVRKYPDSFLIGLVGPITSLQGKGRQYQGPGKMLGMMPEGDEATYFFYSVGSRSFDQVKTEGLGELKTEIANVDSDIVDALAALAEWTNIAYFSPQNVQVDQWVGNGVALLGDSAHTFHPHAGQGVNLSLQDAIVLAEVVENALKTGDVSVKGLLPYQESRKMFADVISRHSHYTATYALSHNRLVRKMNRRALQKMQKDRKLLKEALTVTAGVFEKKPGLIKEMRIGGLLP